MQSFNVEITPPWLRRVGAALPDHPFDSRGGPLVGLAVRLLDEFEHSDASSPLIIEGLALELLGLCIRVARNGPAAPPWLRQVRDLLREHCTTAFTLAGLAELTYRRWSGEPLVLEDYLWRFPQHAELIRAVFRAEARSMAADSSDHEGSTGKERNTPGVFDLSKLQGRYRITGKLGGGGFGIVYKGYDDELRRDVAIKVPHWHRIAQPEDVEAYLAEARLLASLDHPHIVPVHDVGRMEDGRCFVVSKFIDGSDLQASFSSRRCSCFSRFHWCEDRRPRYSPARSRALRCRSVAVAFPWRGKGCRCYRG